MDLWVTGMGHGSNAPKNSRSRDEKAKDNLEWRTWFAVLKNKEETQTETENEML